ncbi:MAG: PadR family transcriptional regulator [Gemmatimonadota bacterium]
MGEFEHLVLLAILRLSDEAYGASVFEELTGHTNRPILRPAVYNSLRRLEAKGLVRSELGDPTPERGGRAKRFVQLTAGGMSVLHDSRRTLLSLWDGVATEIDGATEG